MHDREVNLNTVINTPFFKELLRRHKEIFDDTIKRPGYSYEYNNHHLLTPGEKRIYIIFKHLNNLISTTRDVGTIKILIKRFPPTQYLEKNDLTKLEYIKFYFESYIHKIHTICEIMKLATNAILNINLPPKDCNWKNLMQDKNFKNSETSKVIQQFYDQFKSVIEKRHLNSHRGHFVDKEMEEIDLQVNLYKWSKKYNLDTEELVKVYPPFLIDYRITTYRKRKLNEIKESEKNVLCILHKFFISLDTAYLK